MNNNDSLRSIRYILNATEAKMIEICKLSGLSISQKEMYQFLLNDDEDDFEVCSDNVMAHFLNGLVIFRRGIDLSRPPAPLEQPVTNNSVLKKLKVAFELREEQLIELIGHAGLKIGKPELSSFLRGREHRNFRPCGDQVLRNFLKGLAIKIRG